MNHRHHPARTQTSLRWPRLGLALAIVPREPRSAIATSTVTTPLVKIATLAVAAGATIFGSSLPRAPRASPK
jgi:hypothetical protein